MSRGWAYLDSSAIVKLIVAEEESLALRDWIDSRPQVASCALAMTEVPRAVRHIGPAALSRARDELRTFELIALDDRLLESAAVLDPAILRSLDAIHLAAASSLGTDLDVIVSYDIRMLEGARALGFPTERPS